MKKILLALTLIISLFTLSSCKKNKNKLDVEAFIINGYFNPEFSQNNRIKYATFEIYDSETETYNIITYDDCPKNRMQVINTREEYNQIFRVDYFGNEYNPDLDLDKEMLILYSYSKYIYNAGDYIYRSELKNGVLEIECKYKTKGRPNYLKYDGEWYPIQKWLAFKLDKQEYSDINIIVEQEFDPNIVI